MRHSFYIFLDKELGRLAESVVTYMHLNSSETKEFFHAATVSDGMMTRLSMQKRDDDAFYSDQRRLWQIFSEEAIAFDSDEEIYKGISDWVTDYFTVASSGDGGITINVVMPLWKDDCITLAKSIATTLHRLAPLKKNIDLINVAPDLYKALGLEEQPILPDGWKENIKSVDYHRCVILSNYNDKGAALLMEENDTLSHVICDYAIAALEDYTAIYPAAEEVDKPELMGIGVSEVYFDKYFFGDYLLHRAYLTIMKREGIDKTGVDINKVSSIAQKQLQKYKNLSADFFDKEAKPIMDKEKNSDAVVTQVDAKIEEKISELSIELRSSLADPNLSLPEKEAIVAMILGYDDPMLVNYLYDTDKLIFDDCYSDSLQLFIDENNRLPRAERDSDGNVITPSKRILTIGGDNDVDIVNPLPLLKEISRGIMEDTTFIRQKEKEMEVLQKLIGQETDTHAVLTLDGIIVDGHLARNDNAVYKTLEETYIPCDNIKEKDVDMRAFFTQVKNQGDLGACTAFAVTSIYEYILAKNEVDDSDLSERFLYYNVKSKEDIHDNKGTSYNDIIQSAGETGICEEILCPYDTKRYDEKPSETAYNNGLKHKIKKALDVNVKHEDFISALTEGYPVAISLRLFDSFLENKYGIVNYPTDEEINNPKYEYSRHAMVMVGCDIANKLYIVRNSWGEEFGDKGYCYIPFDYIENPKLCYGAFIITEIDDVNTLEVKGLKTDNVASFDTTDNRIKFAVISNLVEQRKRIKDQKETMRSEVKEQYEELLQQLCDNGKRKKIAGVTDGRVANTVRELKKQKFNKQKEVEEKIKDTEKGYKSLCGILSFLTAVFLLWFGYRLYDNDWNLNFDSKWPWALLALAFICLFIRISAVMGRRNLIKDLEEKYGEEIAEIKRRITRTNQQKSEYPIRYHIAGMFIDKLHKVGSDLSKSYYLIKPYVANLNKWYQEELETVKSFYQAPATGIFKPVIKNSVLDAFIMNNAGSLFENVHLYEYIYPEGETKDINGNPTVLLFNANHNTLEKFKTALRDKVYDVLMQSIASFSMFDYLTGEQKYPYLPTAEKALGEELKDMERASSLFLQLRSTIDMANNSALFISIKTRDEKEASTWRDTYTNFFIRRPATFKTTSPFRVLLIRRDYANLDQAQI